MATLDVNTDHDTLTRAVQGWVDNFQSALWGATFSTERLEQKLAKSRFCEAEKTCVRYAYKAVCATHNEADDEARWALSDEWHGVSASVSEAWEAAFNDAERTGDYLQPTRIMEMTKMVDTCIEVALTAY